MNGDEIYYEDQTSWSPGDFYALWRYLNRLFLNNRDRRVAEIDGLDLSRMSEETRYLMKHLLILQGRFELVLVRFPNLRGLEEVKELNHPLYLSEKPLLAHPYFTEVGIYL
ncbi:hypothetical protein [Psychromicrobium sp. YIM B11713]|uniref:hypothetical protein n=1 Tax=Psychromicrobium sp. YIM B11713 TaxID=3145233 RepID=UPI00374EFC93